MKIKINFHPSAPLFWKTADERLNIYFVRPHDFNTKVLTGSWGYWYENIYQAKLNVLVVKKRVVEKNPLKIVTQV